MKNSTHIHNIVVKQQPEPVALDDREVVPPVDAGAAMHHHCSQVVQALRVHCVVALSGLETRLSINCHRVVQRNDISILYLH